MKKFFFSTLLFSILLGFVGCKDTPDFDSGSPYVFTLYIHLSDFADDVDVKLTNVSEEQQKYFSTKVTYNKEESLVVVDFCDPAATHPKKTDMFAHEYIFTLTSNSVLSQYPDGYQLKVVSNDTWSNVAKIYDKDGKEIPFVGYGNNDPNTNIKIEIDNAKSELPD